jgi:DNA-binding MarR family transcriptional regulator
VYLRISDTGNELLPQLRAAAMNVLDRHLAGFSPTEVAALKQFLVRLIENGAPAPP